MKAMVLAAGVGSRLRPLTDRAPKAAMTVAGRPMLEIVLRRLIKAGVDAAVVNVHHLPDQVEALLAPGRYGIPVQISREKDLLETGGGLKKAAWFFDDGRPFFLHNVDIYTELDLAAFYRAHEERPALATLAVRERKTSRRFLFDEAGLLKGWEDEKAGRRVWHGGLRERALALAFDGVHVVSPEIFPRLSETGAFSLTQAYLRLAGEGAAIRAFRSDGFYWQDIGSAARLEQVRLEAEERGLGF